jgi:hypothetical protein
MEFGGCIGFVPVSWTKPLTAPPVEESDTMPADGCAKAGSNYYCGITSLKKGGELLIICLWVVFL